METVCVALRDIPYGFSKLTLPDKGDPIPCPWLINEMVRLGGVFSFLRRSFFRDTAGLQLEVEIPRIRHAIQDMKTQAISSIQDTHLKLRQLVATLSVSLISFL
ncbi:MAG: hypothetical protein FJY97_05675 [candidate division Zixibacteria bacterium]|nr:hypothetical protein [candidate division Zixibacteria bacterium]